VSLIVFVYSIGHNLRSSHVNSKAYLGQVLLRAAHVHHESLANGMGVGGTDFCGFFVNGLWGRSLFEKSEKGVFKKGSSLTFDTFPPFSAFLLLLGLGQQIRGEEAILFFVHFCSSGLGFVR
jgi:hypothetical protein